MSLVLDGVKAQPRCWSIVSCVLSCFHFSSRSSWIGHLSSMICFIASFKQFHCFVISVGVVKPYLVLVLVYTQLLLYSVDLLLHGPGTVNS